MIIDIILFLFLPLAWLILILISANKNVIIRFHQFKDKNLELRKKAE